MVHPYYEISRKGLENNNQIQVQVESIGDLNVDKIVECLGELESFTKDKLVDPFKQFSKDGIPDLSMTFDVSSEGFLDNKKKIDDIITNHKSICEIFYNHDISGLTEDQVVNLTYLRNISLSSGYIVKFNLEYSSDSVDKLTKSIKKAVRLICKDLFGGDVELEKSILESYDPKDLRFEDNKYYSTIHIDVNESLKEYLSSVDFYEELLDELNDVSSVFDVGFSYDTICSNGSSVENIYLF